MTEAVYEPLDVTDAGAWRRVVDATVARWGRVDVLVNNAGIFRMAEHRRHHARSSGTGSWR